MGSIHVYLEGMMMQIRLQILRNRNQPADMSLFLEA